MTRLLLVAAALAILVLAGVAAAAMPPVPYFSQCDSRWGSDKLGGDGPTIDIRVYRPGTGEFFMDATLPDVSASKTIYVDDDFDDEPSGHRWDTIQEGVNDASDGDTVVVHAGEYVENVNIYGQGRLTLIGEGTDVVTVTAASADDDVFEVFADYVNISGFTVTGATQGSGVGAGICLFYAEHCNISNNNISNNSCGIYMEDTSNNTLRNNTISGSGNSVYGNGWSFGVFGKNLSHYIHDIDTSNTVNGKPIYYGSLVIRVAQSDGSCIQRVPLEVKIYALEQMFGV